MVSSKKQTLKETLHYDMNDRYFFLRPKHFVDFFFFFFFRCLYATIFDFIYISLNRDKLLVNKEIISNSNDYIVEDTLFVGDSTICFPVQEYSFPYLYFNDGNTKTCDILAKVGLNSHDMYEYFSPILKRKKKKYDLIFVSCFLNEEIKTGTTVESFEKGTHDLLLFLKSKLKKNGRIIYVYGDISQHPIIPSNYFKKYFSYKTKNLIPLLDKYKDKSVVVFHLMDIKSYEPKHLIKKYFYKDCLHFSREGQIRLYNDLLKNLSDLGYVKIRN